MKVMKGFLVFAMVAIFLSSLTVPLQAAKLKTKHIGFILKVDDKAEIEQSLRQITEELNEKVEKISSELSKKEMKNADLFFMSYEIKTKKKFEYRPDMIYEITYGDKGSSLNIIYHQQKEKMITFVFPKEKTSQILKSLREAFLFNELGLDNYL